MTSDQNKEERFCSSYTLKAQLGDGRILVYLAPDKPARILPAAIGLLLDCCRSFRTIDEHAERVANQLRRDRRRQSEPNVASIKADLIRLAKNGLLVSESDFLALCSVSEPESRIETVGVITCDRMDSLQRCLKSHIENRQRHGRVSRLVVMDDSEGADTRSSTRDMLSQLKREHGFEIWYGGFEEKSRFAAHLISRGGFDAELVNFALASLDQYDFSCGKNRNALLLHTIGELILSMDDDAVCRLALPPASEHDSEQGPGGQPMTPTEFWFFPDRQTAIDSVSFTDEDMLAVHEEFLGRRSADCLARFGDVGLLNMERGLAHHLQSLQVQDSRVLVTLTGTIGDCGTRIPLVYNVIGRRSRELLVKSEESYRSGCSSRELLRACAKPYLSNRPWFISTSMGLDNRQLLAPFFPVLRGTDGIFAETLRRCYERSYFADLPRAVLHVPVPPRRYSHEEIIASATTITMNRVMAECILSLEPWRGDTDGSEKMHRLSKHLINIGSLKLEDFEELVRLNIWRERIRFIANLERDLNEYPNAPEYWVRDIQNYLRLMRESLMRQHYTVPQDLIGSYGIHEARAVSRSLVLKFGRLLLEWPGMIECARTLRNEDIRPAERIH